MTILALLRSNRNYRRLWTGQIVSEVGDHFNNIAVLSLALAHTQSGMSAALVMLARAIPAVMAGPIAGVLLDRLDRRQVMIASDLVRAVLALGFILSINHSGNGFIYVFSALLMFASPFFTSGRSAILPTIATKEELHAANSVTQITGWMTLTIGAALGGLTVSSLGYPWAFTLNSLSFVVSALCVSGLRLSQGSFRVDRAALSQNEVVRPWREYSEGLRYMIGTPLILGIALVGVGWATGGGAAQVLFSLFGELVFHRGPAGIGVIWSFAGLGLLAGGTLAFYLGKRISFRAYKLTVVGCYIVHGGGYIIFSQMRNFRLALLFIAISRAGVAVSSVLNQSQLLHHVDNRFRGRVFSTMESMQWSVMMLSMGATGLASTHVDIRTIGLWAGVASSTTALFWGWAHFTGRLPEPALQPEPEVEMEVHGDPVA
jgi:MFS family permease